MPIHKSIILTGLLSLLLLIPLSSVACSMYKITAQAKTMVGCNHDTWLTTPKIWFENGAKPFEYGAAFTGAREVSGGRTSPQSGMNTAGLVFSRLTSYYPAQENPFTNRLKIEDEVTYLSSILHTCATIEQVENHINLYAHNFFMEDVFIYIDSLGDYLIVEPYRLIAGNNPNYVLANFCPSITSKAQAMQMERYKNGELFLQKNPAKPTLQYCTALADTMHVCRNRNGDGTLLTTLWDTKDKSVNLFFYHVYDSSVSFNLADELAKGDYSIPVPSLFPVNQEFRQLLTYKTPANTVELRVALVILAATLGLIPFLLLIYRLTNRRAFGITPLMLLVILLANTMLIGYVFILITNQSIFYFDAPYVHHSSAWVTLSSYVPFAILVLMPVILFRTIKLFTTASASFLSKALVATNSLSYLLLLCGFVYWGLYEITW